MEYFLFRRAANCTRLPICRPRGGRDCRQWLRRGLFRSYPSRMKSTFVRGADFTNPGTMPRDTYRLAYDQPTDTPLEILSKSMTVDENASRPVTRSAFWPKVDNTRVATWLFWSAGSVFGLVVFGGLTRLTESGLSITEWRPVAGSIPPLSEHDWVSEFDKYRASPEFALLNPNITLSEFKKIYWMEWGHRLWGRVVGVTFIVPLAYFVFTKKVTAATTLKLCGIGSLIGFQGFLGWWMVKSGLKDDLFEPGSHPRVSQYRLVAHLGTAFIIYGSMLTTALHINKYYKLTKEVEDGISRYKRLLSPSMKIPRRASGLLAGLVFVTAMSGGIVAGLDAGMIYNEWPLMDGGFSPPKAELFKDFYSRRADKADKWWRNMLENPAMAQLDHRILAVTTFSSVVLLWAYSRFNYRVANAINRRSKVLLTRAVQVVCLQASLGITTLLYLVPLPLASLHQAGSLALLTVVLALRSQFVLPARWRLHLGKILSTTKQHGASTVHRQALSHDWRSASRRNAQRSRGSRRGPSGWAGDNDQNWLGSEGRTLR